MFAFAERRSIRFHLLPLQLALYADGQDELDELVVVEDGPLADTGRSECFKVRAGGGWPVRPRERLEQRFHKRNACDAGLVATRPVETESRAPVMTDESDPIQFQGVEPDREVAGVVKEPILDVRLARATHADEVYREAPPRLGQSRHYV